MYSWGNEEQSMVYLDFQLSIEVKFQKHVSAHIIINDKVHYKHISIIQINHKQELHDDKN